MSISYMTPTGPIPIPVSGGGAISLETLKKIADIEKELFNLKQTIASDTTFGLSKITSASDVTQESGIAMSAIQNNKNIEGTIANRIEKIVNNETTKIIGVTIGEKFRGGAAAYIRSGICTISLELTPTADIENHDIILNDIPASFASKSFYLSIDCGGSSCSALVSGSTLSAYFPNQKTYGRMDCTFSYPTAQ